jgi:hypothetical protein
MRKFKLIKEYPNSPKLGKICKVPEHTRADNEELYYHITKSPEYWQEVIEKDYEILSYKSISEAIWTENEKGLWINNIDRVKFSINALLHDLIVKIHSVKRLSDGKIFTIGDKVTFKNINSTIKSFRLEIEALYVDFESGNGVSIKYVEKSKQPLFTTEDDVDIFENVRYYWVFKTNIFDAAAKENSGNNSTRKYFSTEQAAQNYINSKKVLFTTEDGVDVFENKDFNCVNQHLYRFIEKGIRAKSLGEHIKIFSTKEAAEEYVLMNKPCLSILEIHKLLLSAGVGLSSKKEKELREIVKQKIKNNG